MAKNKKLSSNNSVNDELARLEREIAADLSMDDDHNSDSKRKVTDKVKDNFKQGVKNISLKDVGRSLFKASLPEEYTFADDSVSNTLGEIDSLYDKSKSNIRSELIKQRNSFRLLTPAIKQAFGEKTGNKYGEFFSSPDGRNYDQDDKTESEISDTLKEVFVRQQKQAREDNIKSETNRVYDNKRTDIRFSKQAEILSGIRSSSENLLNYHEQIDYNYKKKMLDISLRHLVEAKKTSQLLQIGFTQLNQYQQAILKNTGLPDIVKLRLSEQAGGLFKQGLIGRVQERAIDRIGGTASKFFNNLTDDIMYRFSNLGDMLGNGAELKDGFRNRDARGAMLGQIMGWGIGQGAGWGINKAFNTRENKNAKVGLNKAGYFANNASNIVAKKIRQSSNPILSFLSNYLPSNMFDSGLRGSSIHTMHDVVPYDNAARRSIVEIIPGLLGRILQSSEGIRTGEIPDLTVYDYKKNDFTKSKQLGKDLRHELKTQNSTTYMNTEVDKLIDDLVGSKKLSSGAYKALKYEIYDNLIDGKMFDPSRLAYPEIYARSNDIPNDVKAEIKEALSSYQSFDPMKKDFWKNGQYTNISELDKRYRSAMSSFSDPMSTFRNLDALGQKGSLDAIGLIGANGDIDKQALIRLIAEVSNGTSNSKDTTGSVSSNGYGSISPSGGHGAFGGGINTISSNGGISSDSGNTSYHRQNYESIAGKVLDVFITGDDDVPILLSSKMASGDYFTKLDNKPILTVGDISGEVVDKDGQTLISRREITKGLYCKVDGRAIYLSGLNRYLNELKSRVGNKLSSINPIHTLQGMSFRSIENADIRDVFVKGQTTPALKASGILSGDYTDTVTGEIVTKFWDIKNPIKDKDGNLVITHDDIMAGLYYLKDGNLVPIQLSLNAAQGIIADKMAQGRDHTNVTALKGILSPSNEVVDVYSTMDMSSPILLASKMKAGEYLDKKTGQPILTLGMIRGEVIDTDGNLVVTKNDLLAGLCRFKNGTMTSLSVEINQLLSHADVLDPMKLLGNLKNMGQKAADYLSKVDVYVKGNSEPSLRKVGFEQGLYFDKTSGRVLDSIADINGEVIDKGGNVLLSNDDIKKGLVDKDGFKLTKYMATLMKGLSAKNLLGFAYKASGAKALKSIVMDNKISRRIGRGIRGTAMLPFKLLFGFNKFNVGMADKAMPSDASDEAVLLNRIFYSLQYQKEGKSAKEAKREKEIKDYQFFRFQKQKKEDKVKDEESRVNSWRWKLLQPKAGDTKEKKEEKAKQKYPWLSFILGGLVGLGGLLVKGFGKVVKGLGTILTKGIVGSIGSLIKGTGKLALMGAGKLASAVGTSAIWLGRLAVPLIANPIGLTITAIAVTGLALYFAYKWYSGLPTPLQRYRYAQYGVDLENNEMMDQIAAAENYFFDHLTIRDRNTPVTLDTTKFDIKGFANLCGVQLGDVNDVQTTNWITWFDRRFRPTALMWATMGLSKYGVTKFIDMDNQLQDSQKVNFAIDVKMNDLDANSPCYIFGGPNPFIPTVTGIGVINREFKNIYDKYHRDMPKTEQGKVNIDDIINPEVRVEGASKATLTETVKEGLTAANSSLGTFESTITTGMNVDGAYGAKITTDEGLVSKETSMMNLVTPGNFRLAGDDEYYQSSMSESPYNISTLTLYRFMCYGLPKQYIGDHGVLGKLLQFERDLLRICKIAQYRDGSYHLTTGNITLIGDSGDTNKKVNDAWTTFEKFLAGTLGGQALGFNAADSKSSLKDVYLFYVRVMAVMGKFIALLNKHYKGTDFLSAHQIRGKETYDNFLDLMNARPFIDGRPDEDTLDKMRFATGVVPYESGINSTLVIRDIWLIDGLMIYPDIRTSLDRAPAIEVLKRLKMEQIKGSGKTLSTSKNIGNLFGINHARGFEKPEKIKDTPSTKTVSVPKDNHVMATSNMPSPSNGLSKTGEDSSLFNSLMGRKPDSIRPENEMEDNGEGGNFPSSAGMVTTGELGTTALPSAYNVVTSLFGMRKIKGGEARMHKGIDLRGRHGDPVYAFKDGVVVQGWGQGYGTVAIAHDNGLVTRYLHNASSLVKKGQKVKAGEQIAVVGGRGPRGNDQYEPHIHFETIANGQLVNPLEYLLAGDHKLEIDDGRTPMGDLTTAKRWEGGVSNSLVINKGKDSTTSSIPAEQLAAINTITNINKNINTTVDSAKTDVAKIEGTKSTEVGGPELDLTMSRQQANRNIMNETYEGPLNRTNEILLESYKTQISIDNVLKEIRSILNARGDTTTPVTPDIVSKPQQGGKMDITKMTMPKPIIPLTKY